ncbi:hypothetical protein H4W19_01525 [Pseudoxanthomonas mexicana]|uniref:Uncharacterized protein n=1 Tax=Pseudoxanthomonas mexicana TaxID=128785 RepID=A0ABX6RB60_PSEMX|nr:hypothetical protein [Pseudoxanthomonas mexicana]QND80513.1 hypothetical protein H4W19_01525 [Pseudoxanthomonas mexicana]
MAAVMGGNPFTNAEKILFKTLPDGDWRKFVGSSNNDPQQGGGARDLRFNGIQNFQAIASSLFPNAQQVTRTRNGVQSVETVFEGKLRYGPGAQQVDDAVFEPPTTARPLEWRFTQVSSQAAISSATPQAVPGDQDVLILIQYQQPGELVAVFSTLNTLPPGQIATFIKQVCAIPRPVGHAAAGYFDLVSGLNAHN